MIVLIHDRPEAARPDQQNVGRADGVVTYLRDVSAALRETGQTVVNLALGKGLNAAGSREDGWFIRPIKGIRRDTAAEEDVIALLSDLAPKVLHFHGIEHVLHPAFLKRLALRWPSVTTLHDVGRFCPKSTRLRRDSRICDRRQGLSCLTTGCFRPTRFGELVPLALVSARNRALASMARILCPSAYLADVAATHGLPPDRLQVLQNFSRFPPRSSTRPGTGQLLFVGRMEPEKGFDHLIGALDRLRDLPWHLTAIGAGTLRQSGIVTLPPERVTWQDPMPPDTLDRFYASADLTILPYVQPEAFGMVGVEALSQGCPVVGFPAGGATEWMRPENGAFAVAQSDTVALSAAIRRHLTGPPATLPRPWTGTAEVHACRLAVIYDEARAQHG